MNSKKIEISVEALKELNEALKGYEGDSRVVDAVRKYFEPEERVVNLTGHPINIMDHNAHIVKTIPCDGFAKVSKRSRYSGEFAGIPLFTRDADEQPTIEGLPDPEDGVLYVVPSVSAIFLEGIRDDIAVVSRTHKDRVTGEIDGCQGLMRV